MVFTPGLAFLSGLPKGTILGPILFIICISDLPDVCEQFVNVFLFANDAKIYKHVITDNDHQLLQEGFNAFQYGQTGGC